MKRAVLYLLLFLNIQIIFAQKKIFQPVVVRPVAFSLSSPLREMESAPAWHYDLDRHPNTAGFPPWFKESSLVSATVDPVLQNRMGNRTGDTLLFEFEGVPSRNRIEVPDVHGDVGSNHYIHMVNASFAVYDKQGTLLYGPVNNKTIWSSLGLGVQYDCDPIVLYDHLADRWMMGEMAYDYPNGPYYIVVAVTQTSDPLGAWYCYAYYFEDMADYPKFGVWEDGYYMTVNQVEISSYEWAGAGVCVYDRDSMLVGHPDARMIYFDLEPGGYFLEDPFCFLPSDLDGDPPPYGTPNYLCYFKDDAWGFDYDFLSLWECAVDWEDIENSTLQEVQILETEPFDANNDNFTYITQPVSSNKLQSLANKMMFPMHYRYIKGQGVMTTNHTVDADGTDHAGVRWYILRERNGNWMIEQQGTYAPDENHRWMGSIAMDKYENVAIGYSISSTTIYPSVRFTGRYADDPPGIMTLEEKEIFTGTGYYTNSYGRWGDYSMMAVDPTDELTFWYTQQYFVTPGFNNWHTRVGVFRFAADTITAVPETGHQNKPYINIFPNPFTTNLTLFLYSDKTDVVNIAIYNMSGGKIKNLFEGVLPGRAIEINWDGKNNYGVEVVPGIYLCSISIGSLYCVEKIVKIIP